MRNIKFRAWDTKKKKWLDSSEYQLGWINNELVINPVYNGKGYMDEEWSSSVDLESDLSDHVELMQYTGLLDKNGKEIYEGDILQYNYQNYKSSHLETIKWYENGFFHFQNEDVLFGCKASMSSVYYEIIGNIFENPELLNQPKTDNQ